MAFDATEGVLDLTFGVDAIIVAVSSPGIADCPKVGFGINLTGGGRERAILCLFGEGLLAAPLEGLIEVPAPTATASAFS